MKILIAISSKTYSGETLSVGMKVGEAFKAPTTIVDVGEKINQFSMKKWIWFRREWNHGTLIGLA